MAHSSSCTFDDPQCRLYARISDFTYAIDVCLECLLGRRDGEAGRGRGWGVGWGGGRVQWVRSLAGRVPTLVT